MREMPTSAEGGKVTTPADPRLAALLADKDVQEGLKNLRADFWMQENGQPTREEALILAVLRALDRSAPETCDDVAKRLVEETRHMKFITDPPETPEAVREAAHIAVGRFLPPSLQREAANIVDAVAPLLEAPLRTEIERLADEYRDEQQRRYAANAEVSRLTQQLAVVEGAVREWQETRHKFYHEFDYETRVGNDPFAHAERRRLVAAEKALATLSLEAPRE